MERPDPVSPASPEALLAHAGWVRDLARRLVSDPNVADELEQETWVAALRRPPLADRPLRGWLATVMRNFLQQRTRGDGRRAGRERATFEGRSRHDEPAADEVVGRASLHRSVVDCVLELDEPYRAVLLLRYFDGLAPSRIAEVRGVPVATVKTQLARGLEQLRHRLDGEHGGREVWMLALAPLAEGVVRDLGATLAPSSAAWKTTALGASIVNAKILVISLGLVAAGGLTAIRILSSESGPAAAPLERGADSDHLDEAPTVPTARPARAERDAVAARPVDEAPAPAKAEDELARSALAPAARLARGRILDAEGLPLEGLAVGLEDDDRTVLSGSGGAFELEVPTGRRGHLVVADPAWTTVLSGLWESNTSRTEVLVVAAPRLAVAGVTVDDTGRPLDDVGVEFALPEDFRGRFREVLDFSAEVPRGRTTGTDGRFELELPDVAGAYLRATKSGHVPWAGPVPRWSTADLELVLETRVPEGQVVRGIVVDGAGTPVADARVSLSFETTVTASDGTFVLETERADSPNAEYGRFLDLVHDTLLAIAPGYLPARVVAEHRDAEGRPVWSEWVEVVLGPPPLSIAGQVLDAEGRPRPAARVWISDPLLFGSVEGELVHVETLLAGRDDLWAWVESDSNGRFRIDGLADRTYVLEVMDPETLEHVVMPNVQAGRSDVSVMLACETFDVLGGRVVDSLGEPVPHVRIAVFCDAFELRQRGDVFGTRHALGPQTISDEEGRFEFERAPKEWVYLRFDGEDTLPLSLGRDHEGGLGDLVEGSPDDLVVTLSRRCHFQLELDPDEVVDGIRMLDADGALLPIDRFEGNRRSTMETFPVRPGHTATLAVADTARELVLVAGDEEVRRVSVTLVPGELTILTP